MKILTSLFHNKKSPTKFDFGKVTFLSKAGNDPFVDWILIVITSCLVACILVVIGGYLYVSTQSELNAQGTVLPTTRSTSQFDVKKLNIVTNVFDGRASQRLMLGTGYKWPKDPSLP